MDILRLLTMEGSDSGSASTIPEAVSLHSDDSSTNSDLSDGFDSKPLTTSSPHDGRRLQHNYFHLADSLLDTFNAVPFNCCGFDEDGSTMQEYVKQPRNAFEMKHSPDRVSVVVEASAITYMDNDFARGEAGCEEDLPFVLGSHFVGVVRYCGAEAEKYGIRKGLRVASIVKWRSGSKSLTVPASNLAMVPNQLDAGDVATLVAVYLPAFQALHHGQRRRIRYSRHSLSEKTVLVTGGGNLVGQAVVRLARWAGAEVYVTAQKEHMPLLSRLSSVHILGNTPTQWLDRVEGRMDVVVDFEYPRQLQVVEAAVSPAGRLVCVSQKRYSADSGGWMEGLEEVYKSCRLTWIKRASLYNFEEHFENNPDLARQDLKFLMKLLATRQIRPQIDRYIHFKDVPNIHAELADSRPLSGAIVCEP